MNRRTFLQSALSGSAAALLRPAQMLAALPKMKINRIRFYQNPLSKTLFNQSFHIVTVETDSGLTGIGEGGSRDTVEQCAQMIMGEDPLRIDHLWQVNYRGYFYPPGREKLPHAIPQWVADGSWFFITINCVPPGKNQLCRCRALESGDSSDQVPAGHRNGASWRFRSSSHL